MARDRAHRAKARSVKPLRKLAPFVLRYPGLLAAFVVFLALAAALSLALPAAFRLVVDCGFFDAADAPGCAALGRDADLSRYFVAGVGVAAALGISSALRYYFISRLGERVVADLRRTSYDHLLSLSPGFYAQVRTGEVLSRLTTDTTLIQTVVGSSVSVAIRTVVTTFGALALMAVVNWRLSLLVFLGAPLVIGPIALFGRRLQRLSRASQDRLADASARASEALRAVETVQAFTREAEERARFAQAVETTFAVAMRRIRVRAVMSAGAFATVLGGLIAVLWVGALQVQAGTLSPGAMTQFVMYAFIAVTGVGMLTETYAEVMRAAGATERLMELISARDPLPEPGTPAPLPTPAHGAIAFEAVSFAYPSRPEIAALSDVSFTVAPGETVALVGPSGAGKSTIFQLLLRFYDPTSGRVVFDGRDVRDLDREALRAEIGVVQQNAPLFAGSALENIRFGDPAASDDDVRGAAVAASAHAFIEKLPDGYDTALGEGGAGLSGGQRQRIAIARAILREAPVLLLDEATSALDSESEAAIQDALARLSANKTTLIIAHRLSTVVNADRIIVLEDGRIAATGTHAALLAAGGRYARFAELQFGAAASAAE
ncbi:MAG: ABC transporter transmembrane domain-containing protein [Pseudomonadota bacterium]